jgi:hypothetical protein
MSNFRKVAIRLGAEAQDRRQKIQAEAQDKLGGLLGNVKKRTRHLRHQLREAVTDATAGLPSAVAQTCASTKRPTYRCGCYGALACGGSSSEDFGFEPGTVLGSGPDGSAP